ncbi:MAG TPA: alternative ribosome rescue aminoacyl-tRNA hydrolase ArfB [Thermoanaerobaculia bacterium]|nr:alternative ribosome rescue aminoacyl-tRNA hydrolase ArfB [Thermoanaerobaculia bacterium]
MKITETLDLPDAELSFVTSRSGGPGGQNVNKLETRVTVRLDLAGSPTFSAEQRARLYERLATRITREGVLQVTSQRHRTQAANREAALLRLAELLAAALREETPRRPTRASRASRERRLTEKRHLARRKAERSGRIAPE